MRQDMVMSYVRDLLEHLTGTRPAPDADGDLPVEFAGASFYVRVVNPIDAIVQVFSVGIADIDASPELLAAINEVNQRIDFARALHVGGQVLIESEIWGSDVNPANFRHACINIARATDAFIPPMLERFGGTPRFELSKSPTYYPPEPPRSTTAGPYL